LTEKVEVLILDN
jgi:hypothetical protein